MLMIIDLPLTPTPFPGSACIRTCTDRRHMVSLNGLISNHIPEQQVDDTGIATNQSLAMLLDRARRLLGTSLQRLFTASGFDITVEQWMILLLLWKQDGLTQRQITGTIGKDKGTISPQLDGLERRGLVTRDTDPGDKRRRVVSLTAQGRALEQDLVPLGFANVRIASRDIPAAELATCKKVLCRVCNNLAWGVSTDMPQARPKKTISAPR